ncbi:MAG: hypothetical protein ACTMKV_09445 [Sphingomonas parapaucimobilis]
MTIFAGCFTCHGTDPRWSGKSAHDMAARHHEATGHPTYCNGFMTAPPARQASEARATLPEARR